MRMWLAGTLMSLSLRVMKRGRPRDLLLDHIDQWFREAWPGNRSDVTSFCVTRRYR